MRGLPLLHISLSRPTLNIVLILKASMVVRKNFFKDIWYELKTFRRISRTVGPTKIPFFAY